MPACSSGIVRSNKKVGPDLWEMEFTALALAREAQPGQFVHIRVGGNQDPLLRRPLSIYDVDAGLITLLYKVVGRGTEILSLYSSDQPLDVMGPLGKGFSLVQDRRVLLVGGGVGIAPLLFLGRELKVRNNKVIVLHGAGSKEETCSGPKFTGLGMEYRIATMDGSLGFKGLVTDLMEREIDPKSIDYIYTCGPEPMMEAVAAFAARNNMPGELSLEEYMACGVGACLGCARKLKASDPSYVKICHDGPVFPLDSVNIAP
ncbi:MAG: dihydroorotate dehydrogenase electron transfer subunit [Syntrophomonadaceae bacterium]|jgi:dihydroorotate dehydrogenase electron transfer subunit|nr:dihydroorotate dehydrogenase electron transfer subunit [Syntrophomonadaceae bacterium]